MTSASAREKARKAALDAIDAYLPDDAAQFVSASTLSDAAIDAYEAALKAAGYVIAETVESMTGRALMMAAQNDEHEKQFRERYVVVPRPQTMSFNQATAFCMVYQLNAGKREDEAQGWDATAYERYVAEARAIIEAATNPAP